MTNITVSTDIDALLQSANNAAILANLGITGDGSPGPTGADGATGPQGIPGEIGIQGEVGADGAPGANGVNGTDGADGIQGIAGSPGVNGANGHDGTDGSPGTDGADGIQGIAGSPGVNGANGHDGTDGSPGTDGADGIQGIAGSPGVNGANGVNGHDGADGAPGEVGPQGIQGEAGADSTVVGPQGIQGEVGPQGIQGEAGPTGADSTVVGPQGIQGEVGATGADSTIAGPQGIQGEAGADSTVVGPQGIQGEVGPQGIQGEAGPTGADSTVVGPTGPTGADGIQGIQGIQGPQGAEGLMPNVDNITIGPAGPAGVVEGLDDILARITSLETYSPLTNVSAGTVSDITYKNKEEIVFENQISNSELQGAGAVAPWTPYSITGLLAHLSSKDLTSAPSPWTDLSGNGNYLIPMGSSLPVLDTTTYAHPMMRYSNTNFMRHVSYHRFPGAFKGKTFCFVHAMDRATEPSDTLGRRSVLESNDILSSTNSVIASQTDNFNADSNAKYHINGLDSNPEAPWNNQHARQLSIVTYQTNGDDDTGAGIIGVGKASGSQRIGIDGVVGEIIVFDSYLSAADVRRVEGYLAHKWGLTAALTGNVDNIPHPYRLSIPVDTNAFAVADWTLQSGIWNTDELLTNSVLVSFNDSPVSVRQLVSLTAGEVYQVEIDRTDTEEALVVKLKTDTTVRWLSHLNDETNEVDVPYDTSAVFEVIGDVPTYIEIDTVSGDLSITNVQMKRKRIASGAIEVLSNNTIRKTTGADGWNAGTSSTEFISGQGEGYVQFQIGQSGKDIKVGLTHNDVDYINTAPYEMLFFDSSVQIQGVVRDTYVSGDWFRIKHDSVNNQIVYQKRDSNLDYQTIYTDSLTTDGRDLYLDTSFFHTDGRINDVSLIN